MTTLTLDDLDLRRCVIGADSIMEMGEPIRLYAVHGHELRPLGTFTSAAAALRALDEAAGAASASGR